MAPASRWRDTARPWRHAARPRRHTAPGATRRIHPPVLGAGLRGFDDREPRRRGGLTGDHAHEGHRPRAEDAGPLQGLPGDDDRSGQIGAIKSGLVDDARAEGRVAERLLDRSSFSLLRGATNVYSKFIGPRSRRL